MTCKLIIRSYTRHVHFYCCFAVLCYACKSSLLYYRHAEVLDRCAEESFISGVCFSGIYFRRLLILLSATDSIKSRRILNSSQFFVCVSRVRLFVFSSKYFQPKCFRTPSVDRSFESTSQAQEFVQGNSTAKKFPRCLLLSVVMCKHSE